MSVQFLPKAGFQEGFFSIEVATRDHDAGRIAHVVNAAYKKAKTLSLHFQCA